MIQTTVEFNSSIKQKLEILHQKLSLNVTESPQSEVENRDAESHKLNFGPTLLK